MTGLQSAPAAGREPPVPKDFPMAVLTAYVALDMRANREMAIIDDPATTFAIGSLSFNSFNGNQTVTFWADGIVQQNDKPTEAMISAVGGFVTGSHATFYLHDVAPTVALTSLRAAIDAAPLDDFSSVFGLFLGGDDQITGSGSADWLHGFAGNDRIDGGDGNDVLNGGDGNDSLIGGQGLDRLDGGAGIDTADYSATLGSIKVKLDGGKSVTVRLDGNSEDEIRNVESVTGGGGNDRIVGDGLGNQLSGNGGDDVVKGKGGGDSLLGGSGNDKLNGGGGVDHLYGGEGNDILKGGGGRDHFVFDTALGTATNVDTIKDFKPGVDDIFLSRDVFTSLQTLGKMSTAHFATGKAADADDYIIYKPNSGKVLYDQDGDGAAYGAVLFAKVGPGLALGAGDFYVTA
jgi:Ca2+-binding RTX toxin-like protein